MIGWLCVLAGAAIGAPARYLVDRVVQTRQRGPMPWGTLTVNVVGSAILGLLAGLGSGHAVPREVMLGLGVGLCGTLTTFSTFGYETLRLYETGARGRAVLNVGVSLGAGLVAVGLGYAVGSAF